MVLPYSFPCQSIPKARQGHFRRLTKNRGDSSGHGLVGLPLSLWVRTAARMRQPTSQGRGWQSCVSFLWAPDAIGGGQASAALPKSLITGTMLGLGAGKVQVEEIRPASISCVRELREGATREPPLGMCPAQGGPKGQTLSACEMAMTQAGGQMCAWYGGVTTHEPAWWPEETDCETRLGFNNLSKKEREIKASTQDFTRGNKEVASSY